MDDNQSLRDFLRRLLGYNDASAGAVDRALRSIRLGQERYAPVVIVGDGDQVPLAHEIHRRTLGPGRPFILCDYWRAGAERPSTRSPANEPFGVRAYLSAQLASDSGPGSLCLRAERMPHDLREIIEMARHAEPRETVQILVCSPAGYRDGAFLDLLAPIRVPSLSKRTDEVPRIIEEFWLEAAAHFGVATAIADRDRTWILERAASTVEEIEKAAWRIAAVRAAPHFRAAASMLGMQCVSLRRWLRRRSDTPGAWH